ncbi:hypothetical protein FACS189490_06650 [Clostridia bacterium]|nr:hypothetical protein FACS189490_06650 [Clostridia bacterium]
MDDIIKALVAIEDTARAVLLNAEQSKKALPQKIENRKKEILREAEEEIARRVKTLREKAETEAKKRISEISFQAKTKEAELIADFDKNKTARVTEILNSIVGR